MKQYAQTAYNQAQVYEDMDPQTLILMLFQGALRFLNLAKEGVEQNDPKKRGENIGKVIAIVAELNSSLKTDIKDEGVEFVKGLYVSILKELPKVSMNNDIKIVNTTIAYITRLKEIWENDVMKQNKNKIQSKMVHSIPTQKNGNKTSTIGISA